MYGWGVPGCTGRVSRGVRVGCPGVYGWGVPGCTGRVSRGVRVARD